MELRDYVIPSGKTFNKKEELSDSRQIRQLCRSGGKQLCQAFMVTAS
uniref:Uncharacterized protein n=1 Tax=Rhizophora mucronata TaxID=61149 RepID=A0A2P2N7A2_RHIMU